MIQIILLDNGIRVANIDYPDNHLVFGIDRSDIIEIYDSNKKVVSASYREFIDENSQLFLTAEDVIAYLQLSYKPAASQADLDTEIASREAADIVLQDNIDNEASTRASADTALSNRTIILENNEYKITYYEIITGTSGSLTVPTGATINQGEFGSSGNAILSRIDGSNKPTLESPKTIGGAVVTVSLNATSAAWIASAAYTDSSVALIYSIRIKAIYYANLTYANIVGDPEDQGTISEYYRGDKTFQTLDTSVVPDTTNKRYQTDNQQSYNDATSSIQTQLDGKEVLVNKATDFSVIDDIKYPTTKAVTQLISGLSAYFFYKTASAVVPAYYQMTSTPSTGGLQTISTSGVISDQKLATFMTNTGSPNIMFLPSGVVRVNINANLTGPAGTKQTQLYAVVSKRILAGIETVLTTTEYSDIIPLGGAVANFIIEGVLTTSTNLLSSDLILVDIYAYCPGGGTAPTIVLGMEDNTAARLELPIAKVDLSSFVTLTGTETLTNKRVTKRVTTIISSATPTFNTDNCDVLNITALATAITSMTSGLSGVPNDFDMLIIRIKDNGTARAITWGTSYTSKGATLPTTTVLGKLMTIGLIRDAVALTWGCVAVAQEI